MPEDRQVVLAELRQRNFCPDHRLGKVLLAEAAADRLDDREHCVCSCLWSNNYTLRYCSVGNRYWVDTRIEDVDSNWGSRFEVVHFGCQVARKRYSLYWSFHVYTNMFASVPDGRVDVVATLHSDRKDTRAFLHWAVGDERLYLYW